MKKGCLLIVILFIILIILHLFFFSDHDTKHIDNKYDFEYYWEFQHCYVQKKSGKIIGGVFEGKIVCFGLREAMLYCLVKGTKLGKNGWYVLDLNSDKIAYLQDINVDRNVISNQYKIKIIDIHDYFGYTLDPRNDE